MTTPQRSRPPGAKRPDFAGSPAAFEAAWPPTWFAQARFGAEFHWGVHSVLGQGENALFHQATSLEAYKALAERWEPEAFDARAWADAAVAAGSRYVIFPARAADGFCLWRTATTPFCSLHTGPGRDFLKELLHASRAVGLRVGISFSLADWSDSRCLAGPHRAAAGWLEFTSKVHAQLAEILTGYGPLDLVQLRDPAGFTAAQWRADELCAAIRKHQPQALLAYGAGSKGEETGWPDTDISEVERPEFQRKSLWQTPSTLYPSLAEHGWQLAMQLKPAAPETALLDQLISTSMAGGNLVVHISPDGRGLWPTGVRQTLERAGAWLATHGEAIYGSQRVRYQMSLRHTRRGRTLYVHFVDRVPWARSPDGGYIISGVRERVKSAFIPGTPQAAARPIKCEWSSDGRLTLWGLPRDGEWASPVATVGLRLGDE